MLAEPIEKQKMNAGCLGRVTQIDQSRLSEELQIVDTEFPFNVSYNRYARGNPGWKNCVLRNDTGWFDNETPARESAFSKLSHPRLKINIFFTQSSQRKIS